MAKTRILLRNDALSSWESSDLVLGKGLVEILKGDGTVTPGEDTAYVHLLDAEPATPKEGDLWQGIDGIWYIRQGDVSYRIDQQAAAEAISASSAANSARDMAMTARDMADYALTMATNINEKVPAQASPSNQLADKAFVNSSVQTATANFRGNWATWDDVPTNANDYPVDYAGSKVPTVNDYLVVQNASGYVTEHVHIEGTWRFKYSGVWATDGVGGWLPEYQVNETPMTAVQLAALNSGVTSGLVEKFLDTTTKIYNQSETQYINGAGEIYQKVAGLPTETWVFTYSPPIPEGTSYNLSLREYQEDDIWYYDLLLDDEMISTDFFNSRQTQVTFYAVSLGAGAFDITATLQSTPTYVWTKVDEVATKSYVGDIEALINAI